MRLNFPPRRASQFAFRSNRDITFLPVVWLVNNFCYNLVKIIWPWLRPALNSVQFCGQPAGKVFMARLQTTDSPASLTDAPNPPAVNAGPLTEQSVPASCDDWLAQPAGTITGEAEPEQGIFEGLLKESCDQTSDSPPAKSFRR